MQAKTDKDPKTIFSHAFDVDKKDMGKSSLLLFVGECRKSDEGSSNFPRRSMKQAAAHHLVEYYHAKNQGNHEAAAKHLASANQKMKIAGPPTQGMFKPHIEYAQSIPKSGEGKQDVFQRTSRISAVSSAMTHARKPDISEKSLYINKGYDLPKMPEHGNSTPEEKKNWSAYHGEMSRLHHQAAKNTNFKDPQSSVHYKLGMKHGTLAETYGRGGPKHNLPGSENKRLTEGKLLHATSKEVFAGKRPGGSEHSEGGWRKATEIEEHQKGVRLSPDAKFKSINKSSENIFLNLDSLFKAQVDGESGFPKTSKEHSGYTAAVNHFKGGMKKDEMVKQMHPDNHPKWNAGYKAGLDKVHAKVGLKKENPNWGQSKVHKTETTKAFARGDTRAMEAHDIARSAHEHAHYKPTDHAKKVAQDMTDAASVSHDPKKYLSHVKEYHDREAHKHLIHATDEKHSSGQTEAHEKAMNSHLKASESASHALKNASSKEAALNYGHDARMANRHSVEAYHQTHGVVHKSFKDVQESKLTSMHQFKKEKENKKFKEDLASVGGHPNEITQGAKRGESKLGGPSSVLAKQCAVTVARSARHPTFKGVVHQNYENRVKNEAEKESPDMGKFHYEQARTHRDHSENPRFSSAQKDLHKKAMVGHLKASREFKDLKESSTPNTNKYRREALGANNLSHSAFNATHSSADIPFKKGSGDFKMSIFTAFDELAIKSQEAVDKARLGSFKVTKQGLVQEGTGKPMHVVLGEAREQEAKDPKSHWNRKEEVPKAPKKGPPPIPKQAAAAAPKGKAAPPPIPKDASIQKALTSRGLGISPRNLRLRAGQMDTLRSATTPMTRGHSIYAERISTGPLYGELMEQENRVQDQFVEKSCGCCGRTYRQSETINKAGCPSCSTNGDFSCPGCGGQMIKSHGGHSRCFVCG